LYTFADNFDRWIFLTCAADAVSIVQQVLADPDNSYYSYYSDSYSNVDEDTINTLGNVANRLFSIALLFQYITNALTIITLVEIGLGFLYVLNNGPSSKRTILRIAAGLVGLLVVVFCAAQVGLYNNAYTLVYNYETSQPELSGYDPDVGGTILSESFDWDTYDKDYKAGNALETAADVILMVTSGAIIGFAGYCLNQVGKRTPFIQHVSQAQPRSTLPILPHTDVRNAQSAVLFLVAAVLQFIRSLWSVIYDAAWIQQQVPIPQAVSFVVDPVLNEWSLFVAFVLIFVIGRRKLGGLWTTAQPWNQGGAAFAAAPPVEYHGQWQQHQQPMGWQQPQPVYGAPVQNGWHQQPIGVPPQQEWRNSQATHVASNSPPPQNGHYVADVK
jgi:hypothetical protein